MSEGAPVISISAPAGENTAPAPAAKSRIGTRRRASGASAGRSRFVKIMRLLLPLLAGSLIALVTLWPQFLERTASFRLGLTDIKIAGKGGQSLINARFEGVDGQRRPFTVTATAVTKIRNSQTDVALTKPKADVVLSNGTWLALTARTGIFQQNGQTLTLNGDVNIFHDAGYEFRTEAAIVDMKRAIAYGDLPVSGQGPLGALKSTGFRVLDGGNRVVFMGKSTLIVYPAGKEPE